MTAIAATSMATPARLARRWVGITLGATAVSYLLGVGFMVNPAAFGPLSDIGAAAAAGTLVPVAWLLHRLLGSDDKLLDRATVRTGVTGLTLIVLSGLTLAGFDAGGIGGAVPLSIQFFGFGLQGVWMILLAGQMRRSGAFRRRTSSAALAAGVGYVAGISANALAGFGNPVFYIGFLMALVGFMAWALWIRSDLNTEKERG